MISSLPILDDGKDEVDFEQGKLAYSILRRISSTAMSDDDLPRNTGGGMTSSPSSLNKGNVGVCKKKRSRSCGGGLQDEKNKFTSNNETHKFKKINHGTEKSQGSDEEEVEDRPSASTSPSSLYSTAEEDQFEDPITCTTPKTLSPPTVIHKRSGGGRKRGVLGTSSLKAVIGTMMIPGSSGAIEPIAEANIENSESLPRVKGKGSIEFEPSSSGVKLTLTTTTSIEDNKGVGGSPEGMRVEDDGGDEGRITPFQRAAAAAVSSNDPEPILLLQDYPPPAPPSTTTSSYSKDFEAWDLEGSQIHCHHLQALFNVFKLPQLSTSDCESLLGLVQRVQGREDFQWALHQLGGTDSLLFLYGRVIETCPNSDLIQSQALTLALNQVQDQRDLSEPGLISPHSSSIQSKVKTYSLLRYLLNSGSNVRFGPMTFRVLLEHSINLAQSRLDDYPLLESCLLHSWKRLLNEREGPSSSTLFESLLSALLELVLETNPHSASNVLELKAVGFPGTLLSIISNLILVGWGQGGHQGQEGETSPLEALDALRISTLVKGILTEISVPPDAKFGIAIVQLGILPLLPPDLPHLPRKENSFFVFPTGVSLVLGGSLTRSSSGGVPLSFRNDFDEDLPHGRPSSTSPPIIISDEENSEEFKGQEGNKAKSKGKVIMGKDLLESFRSSILEAILSVLLDSVALLPDKEFENRLSPVLSPALFLTLISTPVLSIKGLSLKLLSSYLSRAKNQVMSEFMRRRGFFLAALYVGRSPELANLTLSISSGFGPLSFSLLNAFIYSSNVVTTLLEWVQQDEAGVVPALLSMGFLPSLLNHYPSNQPLPRPTAALLSLVTGFCVTHPKEDPWRVLFTPGIQSSPATSTISEQMIQDGIQILRRYNGKELRKSDSSSRLIWLLERGTLMSRASLTFDSWLGSIFSHHIMEMDEFNETETWRTFVRKHRSRLQTLLGLFLCKVFAPNRGDLEFKQYMIRFLVTTCPKLSSWLPKVIRADESIERAFTAFIRVFNTDAEGREAGRLDSRLRTPSFQSLISNNGNLILTLSTAAAIGLPNELRSNPEDFDLCPQEGGSSPPSQPGGGRLSDPESRLRFETILRQAGILSPSNHFISSNGTSGGAASLLGKVGKGSSLTSSSPDASPDFKTFKMVLESPPASGVSYQELRHCLVTVERLLNSRNEGLLNSRKTSNGMMRLLMSQQGHGGTQGQGTLIPTPPISNSILYFDSVFEGVLGYGNEILETVTRLRTRQVIGVVQALSLREEDLRAREGWLSLRSGLTHPKAPWHFLELYPSFWALDQSEGPGRVRTRLRKEPLRVHPRFVKPLFRKPADPGQPLEFLFNSSRDEEGTGPPLIHSEIQFSRICSRIIPGEEIPGEIILSWDSLHFIPERSGVTGPSTIPLLPGQEPPSVSHFLVPAPPERLRLGRSGIYHNLRRRYTLEDRAVELFTESRSIFFVFTTTKDREEFIQSLTTVPPKSPSSSTSTPSITPTTPKNNSAKSLLMHASLTTMTSLWVKGSLSNFDYLMYLNTAAGRTYCDLMQYMVFPFVLCKYGSPTLDLLAPPSYRDLRKPMAIQDPVKEEHFLSTYNYLKRECESTPFHYGSHYSNSGIVLHFLVRLPPYTQHFLKYQDGSFDIPDRSFHSVETTWRLASRESNTDFKESIPEFYYLPEFLQNLQSFDLGIRQNGTLVEDVSLPPWAKGDARLFTLINRQTLESNHVRKYLGDWIDLIFGHKQTGKAAVSAINVFHPSTYEGFDVDGVGTDDLVRRARRAMVATYGQTPKRLFAFPHPRPILGPIETSQAEVLETVWGIRWGRFLGSPASPDLELVNSREYREPVNLFETPTRVLFWPPSTVIIGDSVVGSWDGTGVKVKGEMLYLSPGDEITACVGSAEQSIWVGHSSGRLTVLQLSPNLDRVLNKVELIGHYKPILRIDLNHEFCTAFTCSGENYVLVWDMNRIEFSNVINESDPIDFVYSSRSTGDLLLLDIQRNRVTLKTINGFTIGSISPEDKIEAACLSGLDPGRNVNVIALGFDYGLIKFYSAWDLRYVSQIKVIPLSTLAVQRLRYSRDGRRLYCMAQTDKSYVTVALQLSQGDR